MANEDQPETATSAPAPEGVIILPPRSDAPATDAAQSVPMAPENATGDPFAYVDWVLLGLLVVLSVLVSSVPAFNADVWMQLATGKLIAEGQYVPGGAEPFSCATEAGPGREAVPWINHSWLYSLILYLLYGAVGGMGVIIVKACVIAALAVVLMMIRTRDTHRFLIAICLTFTVLALSMRLLLQPVLVSYLLLGVTLFILHRAGAFATGAPADAPPHGSRWLWALPVLCVLWVNLDNWFVLGPIVIGLTWAGLALQSWRGQRSRVPIRQLGIVFGVCLVACLVNPFHVRAFQLPPELAYPLVRLGDRVGVTLPDAIAAGGRTLAILHDAERGPSPATLSPFEPGYWNSPLFGYTIAGVCFYPLLGLGLLSFLVNGWLAGKPGGPALQPARFLVWLFFAVLASLLQRLIPFFVIVAGPITALNLGDLLAWYLRPANDGPSLPWAAPIRLGRLVGVLVLAALLLLAWPGWLAGPRDIGGRMHVGWDIPIDASLRLAAERLGTAPPAGAAARVFSTGLDFSCYCAYFAGPGKAKGFMDARYNLYPHAAADFVKARGAFVDPQRRQKQEWASVFAAYHLNHAAVEGFLGTPLHESWWAEADRWQQQFADSTVAVFTWSDPPARGRGDAVLEDWNRLAFGPATASERPAPHGLPEPQNRTLFDRYLEPAAPLPQAAFDMDLKLAYGQFVARRAVEVGQLTLPSGRGQVLPIYSLGCVPLQPGAAIAPLPMANPLPFIQELKNQVFFWGAVDAAPPAVPILALRRAWQAAAAAPDNERCYTHLATAVERLQQQEEYWINPRPFGPPPSTLRAQLRQMQVVAALRAANEIGFTNPALQYRVRFDLARQYLRRHVLDLSAEYLRLADEALDAAMPDDPRLQEGWRKDKKQLADQRKLADADVKQRRRSFDLRVAGRKPMEKILEATHGSYRRLGPDNQEQPDPQGWGLTGMTLEMLADLDPLSLPPQEQVEWGRQSIDLLFKTGQARQAGQLLTKFEKPLGPLALQYRIYRAGTQGDYDDLAKALKERDDLIAVPSHMLLQLTLASTTGLLAVPGLAAPMYSMGGSPHYWRDIFNTWSLSANELFNTRTLRGMVALEAGDAAEAQRLFANVLREAGSAFYTERAIAERYAAFLARYQPHP